MIEQYLGTSIQIGMSIIMNKSDLSAFNAYQLEPLTFEDKVICYLGGYTVSFRS